MDANKFIKTLTNRVKEAHGHTADLSFVIDDEPLTLESVDWNDMGDVIEVKFSYTELDEDIADGIIIDKKTYTKIRERLAYRKEVMERLIQMVEPLFPQGQMIEDLKMSKVVLEDILERDLPRS